MSTLKSFFKDTVVYGFAAVLPRFINLALVAVFTSALGKADFSDQTTWYVYAAFLNVFLTMGIETAFFRYYASEQDKDKVISSSYMILLVTSLLFLKFGWLLAGFATESLGFKDALFVKILVWITVLDTLAVIPFAYLRVTGRPVRFMVIKLTNITVLFIITFFLLLMLPDLVHKYIDIFRIFGIKNDYKPGVIHIISANLVSRLITLLFLFPDMDFLYYCVITIAPTLFEVAIATGFLIWAYPNVFAMATLVTLATYVVVTIAITEWRTRYYRRMNEADNEADARAVDSLLNYETVKYFANEDYEARRYDEQLGRWQAAAEKSWLALGLLNGAQAIVIASGLTVLMWLAASEVAVGHMTVGDLVLITTLMIQLFLPLNILGMMYRDIKQALTDMGRMFELLGEKREIEDRDQPPALRIDGGALRFDRVGFAYDPRRPILFDVSFEVPAGHTVAVVGASGAGKSTLARLLYRFSRRCPLQPRICLSEPGTSH